MSGEVRHGRPNATNNDVKTSHVTSRDKRDDDVVNEGLLFVSVSYGNNQSAFNNFLSAVRKPEKGFKRMCVALRLTFCQCECPSPNFSFTDLDIDCNQTLVHVSQSIVVCPWLRARGNKTKG